MFFWSYIGSIKAKKTKPAKSLQKRLRRAAMQSIKLTRTWLSWLTMTCALSYVAGCATTTIDTYCERTFYITPTASDVDAVSIGLARQIVQHNKRRQAVCE